MVRNSRLTIRISLAAVLLAALIGAWFASSLWTVDAATLTLPGLDEQADWVDAVSLVGEQLIQFFLGLTNAGG